MTDTSVPTSVTVEVVVAATPERAFEAFTAEFGAWWPREHHTGDAEMADGTIEPHVGGRWYERGEDGTEVDWGRVLAWDPPHRLSLSWFLDPDFAPVPDPERASRIDIRFVAVPDGTRVELVHRDLDRHGPGWEGIHTAVGSPNGWPGILGAYVARTEGANA